MTRRIGPFQLESVLGRGGMGTVWRATVLRGNASVAVKTLTADLAREAAYVRELHTEVRAMAVMTHPNIALVLDHGLTPKGLAQVPAGAPWLAMELASGGSLDRARPTRWSELREVLLSILAGLGHAHARGIIHRDIKPGNVLRCTGADLRPGWKVSDFGISRVSGHRADTKIRGTPRYMAPEQFRGQWRDQGPWTDLYSVGCLAWELASGQAPFTGNRHQLRSAHLQRDAPPLSSKISVPPGFEAWMRSLLQKPIVDRVQRAAHAAHSLMELGDATGPANIVLDTRLDTSETWTMSTLGTSSADWTEESPLGTSHAAPVADLPEDWRAQESELPTVHLRGVGLGLFMLRTRRFVGRMNERSALWQALSEVVSTKRAKAVLLQGPKGVGKSRLAQWLAQRAHEVGCTELPLVVHADSHHDNYEGLAEMIRVALGADGLDRPAVERRLFRRLIQAGELDTERAGLCMNALFSQGSTPGIASEHRAVLAWVLGVLGRLRPLIVCLEDVQWSSSSLRFMTAVLDGQRRAPSPILFVVTVRSDIPVERLEMRRMLEGIRSASAVETLEVDGMPTAELVALVRDTYGIDGALAHRLSVRAGGSPLFATQLVGHWAQAGMLQRGPGGFTVMDDSEVALPETLAGLWITRLQGIDSEGSEDWRAAAEIAAFLGTAFQIERWHAAVQAAGLLDADEAVEVCLSQGLLLPAGVERRRLVFVHSMMREALIRRSRSAGRAPALNCAIAQVLGRDPSVDEHERVGGHLLEGQQYEAALRPLFQGARRRKLLGQYGLADDILIDYLRALELAEVPTGDERWIEGWILRAEFTRMNGDTEASLAWARKADETATNPGQEALRSRAARAAGIALSRLGRREEAHADLERALGIARDLEEAHMIALCHTSFSYLLPVMGRIEEAEDHARQALAILFDGCGDPTSCGNAWNSLSSILVSRGRLEEAAHASDAALSVYQEAGNRAGIAMVANDRGDLLRVQGRLEDAEASYRLSLSTYAAVGAMQQHIAELNLGILYMEQGRWRRAHSLLRRCSREFRAHRWAYVEAAAEVGLAACAIFEGDGRLWDRHIARAGALWANTGVDVEFARVSELAARLAERHDPSRAKAAWALAAAQWEGLGRPEEASAARHRAVP